jgi:sterol desaturase/sphingolipid hydroxylase (fatty acid hydroxylase superfamily)
MWTLMLYWLHRAIHSAPNPIQKFHRHHHKMAVYSNDKLKWRWNNLFLYQDDFKTTADFWITEVIPTTIFCFATGHWWILAFHYLWSALIMENLEHNLKIDGFPLSFGKWHMQHHYNPSNNYGLFIGWWDFIFGTYKRV